MVMATLAELLKDNGLTIYSYDEETSPYLAVMIPEFLELTSGWVSEARRNGEPMRLLVDIVDAPGFNAFAASVAEGDVIMVNRDLFAILFNTARALVSHGLILPEISDGTTVTPYVRIGNPSLLVGTSRPWIINALEDSERDIMAYRIAQSGFIYVLIHEINHIFRGHLEYGAGATGFALRAEVGTDELPGLSGLADETLEWDADLGAVKHMLKMALLPKTWVQDGVEYWAFGDSDGPTGTPEQGIQFGTLGPLLCTLIFEASETGHWGDNDPRSHPHALFRYATTVINAMKTIDEAVAGPQDRLKVGLAKGVRALLESWELTFGRKVDALSDDNLDAFVAAHSERVAAYSKTWFQIRDELNKHHRFGGFSI